MAGPGPIPGPGGGIGGIGPGGGIGGIGPGGGVAIALRALPQLRQNFMPGGFSPRQTEHRLGNPWAGGGVWPKAGAAGASELPQFKQNDDPGGLSWPHIEQRISPLALIPRRVSQQHAVSGMASRRFATHDASC
jgi:hypothetical protein